MRLFISVVLIISMFCGCGNQSDEISKAMELRQRLLNSDRFCFDAVITADYGDRMYTFEVTCTASNIGAVNFTVVSPESIAGITGSVSEGTGKLIFDDTVLLFEPLSQGQLTPAIGPWLMVKAVLGGYIHSISEVNDQTELIIDDSLNTERFQAVLTLDNNLLPSVCEIFWNNRRILSLQITNFTVK